MLFTKDNLEYHGLKITRQGVIPLPDQVQANKVKAHTDASKVKCNAVVSKENEPIGQQMKVRNLHKNLKYKYFNTKRVTRWRLILEEFNVELFYIKCSKNIIAVPLADNSNCNNDEPSTESLSEILP